MQLVIVSPDQKKIVTVAWVELNTPMGSYVIQLGHVPMIITLATKEPFIFQNQSGKQESFMVADGVAHVTRTDITIVFRPYTE
jgi:F0F1-type ATP synthase epsilon subunit